MVRNKMVCNHITRTSASKLISALRDKKTEILFTGYVTVPKEFPKSKIKTLYKPIVPTNDVPRITFSQQQALEQKYINEL